LKDEINSYLTKDNWRIKENTNQTYSMAGMMKQLSGKAIAEYTLDMLDKDVSYTHRNHLMHIHDLSGGLSPYCSGWSLRGLIKDGLRAPGSLTNSSPAVHFDTILRHMTQWTFLIANEFSGASAFSDVDTYLAPFIREDKLTYKQVKQALQAFIYELGSTYRAGMESPFSNITLSLTPPKDMKDNLVVVGGKELDYTYGDCQKEMDMFNKAFTEVMLKGDANGKVFAFPIPTYNITKDFDWNSEVAQGIFELTAKTGIPYFSNFINSTLDPTDVRSLCCRLRLDTSELSNGGGGLFGAGELTGSIGVVTINAPRLAFMAHNPNNDKVIEILTELPYTTQKDFFEADTDVKRLKVLYKYTSNMAKKSLVDKRRVVEKYLKHGLFPFTSMVLNDFSNHFNTIGIIGMHEALLNLGIDNGIISKEGKALAEELMDYQLSLLKEYQAEYKDFYKYDGWSKGLLFNFEATPGEGTSYKLALYDKKYFDGECITGLGLDGETPYYTNSTWIPQDDEMNTDIFKILDHQDSLQVKYTSGTVIHFYTEGTLTADKCKDIVYKSCYNYNLPYISISPTISTCPVHGRLDGNYDYCPFDHTEEEIELIIKRGGIVETTEKGENRVQS